MEPDTHREMADVSTPLTEDGRIRARMVGTSQEGNSYIDGYKPQRKAFYGIIEADLTPDTTVSLGYDYQDITPKGSTWGGLPLWFSDGTQAEYSRSKTTRRTGAIGTTPLRRRLPRSSTALITAGIFGPSLINVRTEFDAELLGLVGRPDRATGLGSFPQRGLFRWHWRPKVAAVKTPST